MINLKGAACARVPNPDLFSPDIFSEARVLTSPEIRQAIYVCNRCPVRQACYEHALKALEQGVWGGAYFYPPYMGRRPVRFL